MTRKLGDVAKAGDLGQSMDHTATEGEMLMELMKKIDQLTADMAAAQHARGEPEQGHAPARAAPPAVPPYWNGASSQQRRRRSKKTQSDGNLSAHQSQL